MNSRDANTLYAKSFLQNPGAGTMQEVLRKARTKVRGIVVLHLKNRPEKLAGFNNPLLDEVDAPSYRQMNCRKVVVDE